MSEEYIHLTLTVDDQTKFKDWREIINGQGTGESGSPFSNTQKIEAAINALIDSKQVNLIAGDGISIESEADGDRISATITGIKYEVVSELPVTGEEGVIYFCPAGESGEDDIYNEYIYLDESGATGWEKIGSTKDVVRTGESTATSVSHTFVDNTDFTYKATISNGPISLIVPNTIEHGFLSVINFTEISEGVNLSITNNSSYPLRIIHNNRRVSTPYSFGMTGRKVIFLRCDGQCAEVLIIEEIENV